MEELIDWDREDDIKNDPFYRLVFPTMAMLSPEHRKLLEETEALKDPFKLKDVVDEIREDLNPHPAGQKALNAPKKVELTGVQHKYSETVLFFPAAGQTCHAYCTYAAAVATRAAVAARRVVSPPLYLPSVPPLCTSPRRYCFRWAQFIGDTDLRFAQKVRVPCRHPCPSVCRW